jgi:hypothetical protein
MNGPLFQVRELLRQRGMVSAGQLAAELRLPLGVVEDLLAHWTRRGMAVTAEAPAAGACGSGGCGSCGQCGGSAVPAALYQWREPGAQDRPRTIALRPLAA